MMEREIEICDAAARMFIRYGVKRASMNDIASAAGVARQTLYNLFSNKDEVLVATIRLYMDRAIGETNEALRTVDDIGQSLEIVFEHLARRPYALLNSAPNYEDLIEGQGELSRRAVSDGYQRFAAILERLLAPAEARIRAAGSTVGGLADAILRFACAAKHEARDAAHLNALLATLKAMALGLTR